MISVYHWIYFIVGGIFAVTGVCGNLVVIIYFGFYKRCQKNYDLLIFILGIADFLSSISNLLLELINRIPPTNFMMNEIICVYIYPIGLSINTSASYILVAMFYVRYRCIASPMTNKITKLKITAACVVMLVASILAHLPIMITSTYQHGICTKDIAKIFPRQK